MKSGKLCSLMRCTIPLIQAPMNGSGDIALGIAVAKTGAIGSVPCSGMSAEALDKSLSKHSECIHGLPLNYNFFCHVMPDPIPPVSEEWVKTLLPYYEKEGIKNPLEVVRASYKPVPTFSADLLDVLVKHNAPSISFHFGLPPDDIWDKVKAANIVTIGCATTVAEAKYLSGKGVDVIVAQGVEAGGHRGLFLPESSVGEQLSTFALVSNVRRALGDSACIVAAGGIVDNTTMKCAMGLGADGVQVGTAFLLCAEATTSKPHRNALLESKESWAPTQLTNILSGRPARGLTNTLMRDLGAMRTDAPPFPCGASYLTCLREKAAPQGRSDYSVLWSGQNPSGCSECSAAEKVAEIAGTHVSI